MGRSLMLAGVLVGLLALSAAGLGDRPVAQASRGAVLLRYRFAPGETLAYAYRERLVSTSSTAPTTTALLTFRQLQHVIRVLTTGVATAQFSESPHTLTTTRSEHTSVVTQSGQPPSTMVLYPAGSSSQNAPLFPAHPVSPGDRWSRPAALTLGSFFVRPPVISDTEHLTFTGYGIVNGERVAEVTIAVRVQRPGTAPPGSMWPNARVLVTSSATSTLSIGLTSGALVRVVENRTTTTREIKGTRSTAPGGWFTLMTHTELRRS